MSAEPEQHDIHAEALAVVAGAVRQRFIPLDPLDAPDPEFPVTEFDPFPPRGEALDARGRRFLEGLGVPLDRPDLRITFDTTDGDAFMQVSIANIGDPDVVAEAQLVVTLKGANTPHTIGEFLARSGAMDYILNPVALAGLEDGELLTQIEAAEDGSDDCWMLDMYTVSDNEDSPTVEGAMHVMMDLAEDLAEIKRISVAEPLMSVTLLTRQRRPHRGDRRVEQFVITEGMPDQFSSVSDLYEDLDEDQRLLLRLELEHLEAEIQRRLTERGIETPITLGGEDVWVDAIGQYRIIALSPDEEESDGDQEHLKGRDDKDGGDAGETLLA